MSLILFDILNVFLWIFKIVCVVYVVYVIGIWYSNYFLYIFLDGIIWCILLGFIGVG